MSARLLLDRGTDVNVLYNMQHKSIDSATVHSALRHAHTLVCGYLDTVEFADPG